MTMAKMNNAEREGQYREGSEIKERVNREAYQLIAFRDVFYE